MLTIHCSGQQFQNHQLRSYEVMNHEKQRVISEYDKVLIWGRSLFSAIVQSLRHVGLSHGSNSDS